MQGVIGAGYQPIPLADTRAVVYRAKDDGTLDSTLGARGVFSESVLTEQTKSYAASTLVTAGYARATAMAGSRASTSTASRTIRAS